MAKGKTKTVKFIAEEIENLPKDKPVVYKIKNPSGKNIYTGVAKRGRTPARLKEHLPGGPDPIPGGTTVQIEQMPNISDAKKKEANIISRSNPKHNK